MQTKRLFVLFVMIPVVLLVLGSFQITSAAPLQVLNAGDNEYLADSNGRTLYYVTRDSGGQSTCTGQCVVRWPLFYTEKVMVPAGVDAKEFGVITHPSGQKQTTFRGWPLYYWAGDTMAGDMKGQGLSGVWFYVLNPRSN